MSQRIIIAGMRRSGTHWMYNAVRLLLENAQPGSVYGTAYDWPLKQNYDASRPETYHLLKIHEYCPQLLPAIVMTSDRTPSEVIASYRRFTGNPVTKTMWGEWLTALERWKALTSYHLEYGLIRNEHCWHGILLDMACVLDIDKPNIMMTHCNLRDIQAPPTGAERDPVTLLFPGHRTEGTA